MNDLKDKRLLIIGGAFQHCKLVEAAHQMGVIVYVVDYLPLEKSPAKQIADYHFEYNITDYDDIVEMCKREKIDGVISAYLDACQIPYQTVCERLGLPCFGTKEQFHILTDKTVFIETCKKYGVDVIPQYSEYQLLNHPEIIEYPVFIKPCDSRGSRGQTVCYHSDELENAIQFAKSESKTEKIIAEKYMGGKQEFTMSYLFADGQPILLRTGDRYVGSKEDHMDKSSVLSVSPSNNTELYMNSVHPKVVNMVKKLGIENGPVFMQGFIDGQTVRFFDPGLRFPGCEYDRMLKEATGFDVCKLLIEFALTGVMEADKTAESAYLLREKTSAMLFVVVKPGEIACIKGLDEIKKNANVISIAQKYFVGDVVGEHYNVNQRFCEIDFLCDSVKEMKEMIDWIYHSLKIQDKNGKDMKIAMFDTGMEE